MTYSRKHKFNSYLGTQSFQKMAKELNISIRHYSARQAMQFDNFFEENLGNVTNIIYFVKRYEVSHLTKTIHYDKDRITTLSSLGSPKPKSMPMLPKQLWLWAKGCKVHEALI